MTNIGPHTLRNPVLLAPMAGYSDLPMRQLAWDLGAGYVVSEMVSSDPTLWGTDKSRLRRQWLKHGGANAVQIAGHDPVQMAQAAQRLCEVGAEIIDINFGCPAKKVCRRAAGSALLADPERVTRIVEAVAAAVSVPVTVKMRTGPSPEQRNGVAVAKQVESAGAQSLVVHGRTRACKFNGAVEFATVAAIKRAVSIPVFANGDIATKADMQRVLARTGADGVMVGRAVVGAPWLLGVLAGRAEPDCYRRWQIARAHLGLMHDFYGPDQGVRIARKHVKAYLQGFECEAHIASFNRLTSADQQVDYLLRLGERTLQAVA